MLFDAQRVCDMKNETFEYAGKSIELVAPSDLHGLVEALSVQDILKMAVGDKSVDTEKAKHYKELLGHQTDYIEHYADDLPDYDNTYLNKNIKFLLKQHKLRMRDLENVIGVTKGYISRTMKKEAFRKLSIDVAWKIANVFGVELDKMIDTDFSVQSGNLELVRGFLRMLREQSDAFAMEWQNMGGVSKPLDDFFEDISLFSEGNSPKEVLYHPEKGVVMILSGDIYSTNDSDDLRLLSILPYQNDGKTHYDLVFFWEDKEKGKQSETVFRSEDDGTGTLDTQAKILYECIKAHMDDVPLEPDMKEFMKKYLMRGR